MNLETLKNYIENINKTENKDFSKGCELLEKEAWLEAIWYFDEMIKQYPNHLDSWINKACCWSALKDKEKALVCCEIAIKIAPYDSATWYMYGKMLQEKNQLEKALIAYEQAIKLSRENNGSYLNKGNVLRQLGRYEESLVAIEKTQERLDPCLIFINKGLTFQAMGNYEQAIDCYKKTLVLNPNFQEIKENLEFCEMSLSQS